MTAPKPVGYPCHVDDDLAHIATVDLKRDTGVVRTSDLEPRPCTRRHKPAPQGASTTDLRRAGLLPRTAVRLATPSADVLTAAGLGSTLRPGESIRISTPKTKSAAPTSPASSTRSAPKRPRKAGTAYSDADRDRALEAMQLEGPEGGIAGAHRATGIPKGTLSRWAREAGLNLGARARARTAAAGEAVAAKAAELRVSTVERLERILDDQLATLEALGQLERRAAVAALNPEDGRHLIRVERSALGRTVELDDTTAAGALELARLVTGSIVKRDVVGAATRAIHDLQLLKGDATERGAIVVRFGIPRSSALEADASAVDEADLGAPPP